MIMEMVDSCLEYDCVQSFLGKSTIYVMKAKEQMFGGEKIRKKMPREHENVRIIRKEENHPGRDRKSVV